MELTDLKVFVAIMKEGSITRAAEKLDYVQSNITMRVRKLEEELGVLLFHRSSKGVVPTEKGRIFGKYASDILLMAEEAAMAVKEPDHPSGSLTIGVVETMASTPAFIQALSGFQSKYPEVALSLVTGTSPQNYEKVLGRELDGALFTGEYDLSSLRVAFEIREEVVLLTPAGGVEDAVTPESSKAAWVVFPRGCPLRGAGEDWLRELGVAGPNMIEVSTLDTMLSCVRAGIGQTLLTRSSVPADERRVRTNVGCRRIPYQRSTASSPPVSRPGRSSSGAKRLNLLQTASKQRCCTAKREKLSSRRELLPRTVPWPISSRLSIVDLNQGAIACAVAPCVKK